MERWTYGPDGSVIFPTKREPAHVLVGVVFLGLGGVVLVQLVRAVAASRAAVSAPWIEYLPVVAVFGGLGLFFVIVGIVMALSTREVRLDLVRREVHESRTRLGYRRTTTDPLSAFAAVVLVRRIIQGRRRSTTSGSRRGEQYPSFVVELSRKVGKAVAVDKDQHEPPMREMAEKLAAMIDLPLDEQAAHQRERDAAEEAAEAAGENDRADA